MTTKPDDLKAAQPMSVTRWILLAVTYIIIPLILLVCGGDPGWWQGWIYAALIFIAGVGGRMWAERRHPGLMMERQKFENAPGVKPWDKVLSPLMSVSISFPLYIVAGLDHRYSWSSAFPIWLNILGLALCAVGYAFAMWAMAENRFFSSVVRIQTELGHMVCDSGPYCIVRHPGYIGNILPLPGMVLAFSSLWTIIPAAVGVAVVVIRTALEDRTLQDELPGYREYARCVRYRLFPGIY